MMFVVVGIGVMAAGVTGVIPRQAGVIALGFGFLMVVAGLVVGMRERIAGTTSGTKGGRDVGSRLRIGFAVLALASVLLPYYRIPLVPNGAMATGLDVPQALLAGNAPFGVIVGAAFLAVLVAGVFLSVFHHVGGYVLVLDVIGLTVLVGRVAEIDAVVTVTDVFGVGLYVVGLAALGVLASQFVSSDEGESGPELLRG